MPRANENKATVVLVIEDEPLIRQHATDIVTDAGLEFLEAASADEALHILESRDDICIIFTDIQMPGTMDGLKLAHSVRDRWPPIRIIVTSGVSIIDEGRLPAGSQFFSKPYNPKQIAGVLRDLAA